MHLAISGHPIDPHACKHYNIDDEDYNANAEAVSASLFLHDRMNLQKCLLTSSRGCARSTIPHTLPTRSTKRNHQKQHNQRIESDSAATVQPAQPPANTFKHPTPPPNSPTSSKAAAQMAPKRNERLPKAQCPARVQTMHNSTMKANKKRRTGLYVVSSSSAIHRQCPQRAVDLVLHRLESN
ncbi:hypothetical protein FOXG_20641 [Fusarium oxysporum f. sp. lycopersici 4287]|uniref:Uncharacterized protein n=1 Tax=Fusarium oxysporum f. sp. lycopersici (strain 4287 / CBS 123668 / FGSC 9935 / NRRL 34936) TaxID=426428 RepID=A0A0J9WRE0_FUSO4|nr:hypothetical protein FOXG_20641 [Fusarium oxysporum f. sp. lycopersici 4287]KAJ9414089.1 hypothetical protein QL093DRAFT_1094261 [Fusarium oxysporum]KNB12367.1 hypothetical protein FOXG_20641 [Fusarium oxysporum f. sp. lycopersici 4287]